jgi:Ca2+-binding EF-hand superfamily protein
VSRNCVDFSLCLVDTIFSLSSIPAAILLIYHKIRMDSVEPTKQMTRSQFFCVLQVAFDMADDSMVERICAGLSIGTNLVTCCTWARTMSLFLRGTLAEKMQYCFKVYDVVGNGLITRNVIFNFMKNTLFLGKSVEAGDAPIRDFVDVIVKKMDRDMDGSISFDDYRKCVEEQPYLLECFGQCLPGRDQVNAFLTTLTTKV